ncbi:substrate-binding periplasmic protein [Desulfovibrio ferrophilus]|uniref:Extracellular solute-binding protein family 3 n=1 Tax=Desulfovibrio ferrophilus TaxID=241368 RepID=A0A2Z6AXI4_9BACT|nr:transporter substrate-binding domain-containing protein [Desulfovibrio ferrophilus]BBD07915.1 extracellular solute-binding protein family 3 [Desulfovibrio ferrophilus]
MKRFWMIVLILVFLFQIPEILHAKTLRLVTLNSPPLEYPDAQGQPTGLNMEIALEALRRLGHDAVVDFVPWKRALEMVRSGSADAIVDAGYNSERAAYLHYPYENIYLEEVFAFKRAEKHFTLDEGLGNAQDFRLGVGRGYYYGMAMDRALQEGRFKSIEEVYQIELSFRMLMADRIDMFIGVRVPILYLLEQMDLADDIDIVFNTDTGAEYALDFSPTYVAFSKKSMNERIADEFDIILKSMKEDGTFERIYRRYGLN